MRKILKAENGLTLIEVLASTVLITIVLVSFLTIFAQGAKTNMTSENIMDSTYLAQKEMESIIALAKSPLGETPKSKMDNRYGTGTLSSDNKWIKYEKNIPNSNEKYSLRIKNSSSYMFNVIVEVIEKENNIVRAKMENIVDWKEG